MKTVHAMKARPVRDEVESVTIVIDREFPDIIGTPCTLTEAAFMHEDNAERVVEALCATLPGGTLDRVLAQLFARRLSLLSVPLFPCEWDTGAAPQQDETPADSMVAPSEWKWGGEPVETGWYATTHCWDAQEGMFPGANYWDGAKWGVKLPVIGFSGPFGSKEVAEQWADAHDVEA